MSGAERRDLLMSGSKWDDSNGLHRGKELMSLPVVKEVMGVISCIET